MAAATLVADSKPKTFIDDGGFQVIRKLKMAKKRLREGSLSDVEELKADTDSDTPSTPLKTERRSGNDDLKVLLVPIEKNKNLSSLNHMKIKQDIEKACRSPPEFIKFVRSGKGLLVKCKNEKQSKALSQLPE